MSGHITFTGDLTDYIFDPDRDCWVLAPKAQAEAWRQQEACDNADAFIAQLHEIRALPEKEE